MTEEWRDVGFSSLHEVSSLGNIRNKRTKYVFGEWLNDDGYRMVTIRLNGAVRAWTVHRLVCEAFIGPMPKDYCVDHINAIRNDNRLSNLRYITHSENGKQGGAKLRGVKKPAGFSEGCRVRVTGSKHPMSILTERDVPVIRRRVASGEMHHVIAKDYGVVRATIAQLARGKTWSHVK
jgi:hypothetical protein